MGNIAIYWTIYEFFKVYSTINSYCNWLLYKLPIDLWFLYCTFIFVQAFSVTQQLREYHASQMAKLEKSVGSHQELMSALTLAYPSLVWHFNCFAIFKYSNKISPPDNYILITKSKAMCPPKCCNTAKNGRVSSKTQADCQDTGCYMMAYPPN